MVMPPMGPPMGAPTPPMGGMGMGMGMGMNPMMGPMLDPESVLQMAEMVQRAMEEAAERELAPEYPSWYDPKDYPSPNPDLVLAEASALDAEYAPLRRRMREEQVATDPENPYIGHFRDYDEDEDDLWPDTAISGEIELQAYQLADAQLSFDAQPKRVSHKDEAAKKVDFALASMEHAARLHARAGNGPLALEKARSLLTNGRLVWHCLLNLDTEEGEMPFIEELVDPSTCYPIHEGHRGLRAMYRKYYSTIGEAVAAFDDAAGTLYKALVVDAAREKATQQNPTRRREDTSCEVVEYWDRRWRMLFIDGKPVKKPIEHKYGFVPFVYKVGPLGVPAYLVTPETDVVIGATDYHRVYNRSLAAPHKGVGLPTLLKLPTRLREAMYTRLLKANKMDMEPPLVEYISMIEMDKGTSEISRSPGDVSPVMKDHRQVEAVPVNLNPNTLVPILQGVADNSARLSQPPTAHGLNDHSNVSGYATQGLNEAGRIKLVPWLRTLEEFERECMEMRFRMYRDFGYLIDQGGTGDRYGVITVPKYEAGPDEDQMFELTPGDLRRSGITIKVSMTSMPLQMLGPVANAVGMLMQMGLMDEIGALKLLNVQNPYKTLQRIQTNKVLNDPAMIEADVLAALAEQGEHGKVAYIVARKMGEKQMTALMGGMGGGMGGAPQGGSGAMGDSQAAMGRPPGPGSGPQGPTGVDAPSDPFGTEP